MAAQVALNRSWQHRWPSTAHGSTGGPQPLMAAQVALNRSWQHRWPSTAHAATVSHTAVSSRAVQQSQVTIHTDTCTLRESNPQGQHSLQQHLPSGSTFTAATFTLRVNIHCSHTHRQQHHLPTSANMVRARKQDGIMELMHAIETRAQLLNCRTLVGIF
jgi:hypothetical protein